MRYFCFCCIYLPLKYHWLIYCHFKKFFLIKEWETHELRYLRKQSHKPSLISNAHSLSFACSSNYCLTTALWKFSSGLFYGLWRCVPGSVMLSPSKQFQIFAINSFSQKKSPKFGFSCNWELLFIQVGIIISFSIWGI